MAAVSVIPDGITSRLTAPVSPGATTDETVLNPCASRLFWSAALRWVARTSWGRNIPCCRSSKSGAPRFMLGTSVFWPATGFFTGFAGTAAVFAGTTSGAFAGFGWAGAAIRSNTSTIVRGGDNGCSSASSYSALFSRDVFASRSGFPFGVTSSLDLPLSKLPFDAGLESSFASSLTGTDCGRLSSCQCPILGTSGFEGSGRSSRGCERC